MHWLPRGTYSSSSWCDRSLWRQSVKSAERLIWRRSSASIRTAKFIRRKKGITSVEVNASILVHSLSEYETNYLTNVNVCKASIQGKGCVTYDLNNALPHMPLNLMYSCCNVCANGLGDMIFNKSLILVRVTLK